jgi:hypothetical protein
MLLAGMWLPSRSANAAGSVPPQLLLLLQPVYCSHCTAVAHIKSLLLLLLCHATRASCVASSMPAGVWMPSRSLLRLPAVHRLQQHFCLHATAPQYCCCCCSLPFYALLHCCCCCRTPQLRGQSHTLLAGMSMLSNSLLTLLLLPPQLHLLLLQLTSSCRCCLVLLLLPHRH